MRSHHPLRRGGYWRLALALSVALGAVVAQVAQAQGPNIPVPVPGIAPPPPIPSVPPLPTLPAGQPITLRYSDSDGPGQISLQDVGADTTTGSRLIKVSIVQNGYRYDGSGTAYLLSPSPPYPALLAFSVLGPMGTGTPPTASYFYAGKMSLGVELQAQGTYHPTGSPEQSAPWGFLALPVPPPPPVPAPIPGNGTSGIQGVAVEGPIAPVERPGVPNTRPLPGAIITVRPAGGGPEITRQQADANGQFRIPLDPGSYLIVPLPPQPGAFLPRGAPQTVTVPAGVFVNLTVQYDTGIR